MGLRFFAKPASGDENINPEGPNAADLEQFIPFNDGNDGSLLASGTSLNVVGSGNNGRSDPTTVSTCRLTDGAEESGLTMVGGAAVLLAGVVTYANTAGSLLLRFSIADTSEDYVLVDILGEIDLKYDAGTNTLTARLHNGTGFESVTATLNDTDTHTWVLVWGDSTAWTAYLDGVGMSGSPAHTTGIPGAGSQAALGGNSDGDWTVYAWGWWDARHSADERQSLDTDQADWLPDDADPYIPSRPPFATFQPHIAGALMTEATATTVLTSDVNASGTYKFRLRYNTTGADLASADTSSASNVSTANEYTRLLVQLTGLTAGTQYYYIWEWEDQSDPGTWHQLGGIVREFQTPPYSVIDIYSDPHTNTSVKPNHATFINATGSDQIYNSALVNREQRAIALMADGPAGIVGHNGDGMFFPQHWAFDPDFDHVTETPSYQSDGSVPDQDLIRSFYFKWFSRWLNYLEPLTRKKAFFFNRGNHDGGTQWDLVYGWQDQHWMIAYKTFMAGQTDFAPDDSTWQTGFQWFANQPEVYGGSADGNTTPLETYNVIDCGNAKLFMVDGYRWNTDDSLVFSAGDQIGSTQRTQLFSDLAASSAAFNVVILHNLPIGEYRGGGGKILNSPAEYADSIHSALISNGADLVLWGHDHVLHRADTGLPHIQCGSPSLLLGLNLNLNGYFDVPEGLYSAEAYGFVRLFVGAANLSVAFIQTMAADGETEIQQILHTYQIGASQSGLRSEGDNDIGIENGALRLKDGSRIT